MDETTRLSINITESTKTNIAWFQRVTGATSASEVIRRSLDFCCKIMEEQQQRGKTLHLKDEVGELQQIYVV